MLCQSKGIIIHSLKYGDSGFICKVYTQEHGLISLITQGVYAKKAKVKPSMLQVGSLVDCVYYYKNNREIHRLKELKCQPLLLNIHANVLKSSMVLFFAEVVGRALKSLETDEKLFIFLNPAILNLENEKNSLSNYPLQFLLKLSDPLGFYPAYSTASYFYLEEGVFSNIKPMQNNASLNFEQSKLLKQLLLNEKIDSQSQRATLLQIMLSYYQNHIQGFGQLKTLSIIQTVLRPNIQ